MYKYPLFKHTKQVMERTSLCIKQKFKRIKRTHDISLPSNRHDGIHKTMTIKEMSIDGATLMLRS